ncbi:MAG: hypothetical protein ACI87E_002753 [Mariniblastus sp.]
MLTKLKRASAVAQFENARAVAVSEAGEAIKRKQQAKKAQKKSGQWAIRRITIKAKR